MLRKNVTYKLLGIVTPRAPLVGGCPPKPPTVLSCLMEFKVRNFIIWAVLKFSRCAVHSTGWYLELWISQKLLDEHLQFFAYWFSQVYRWTWQSFRRIELFWKFSSQFSKFHNFRKNRKNRFISVLFYLTCWTHTTCVWIVGIRSAVYEYC